LGRVTYGRFDIGCSCGLARELLAAAEMIVGRIERLRRLVYSKDSVQQIRDNVCRAIENVSSSGVIIMADMFGGTFKYEYFVFTGKKLK
jgi:mannose/fructose-specific phosphotransferase system component IIA